MVTGDYLCDDVVFYIKTGTFVNKNKLKLLPTYFSIPEEFRKLPRIETARFLGKFTLCLFLVRNGVYKGVNCRSECHISFGYLCLYNILGLDLSFLF